MIKPKLKVQSGGTIPPFFAFLIPENGFACAFLLLNRMDCLSGMEVSSTSEHKKYTPSPFQSFLPVEHRS